MRASTKTTKSGVMGSLPGPMVTFLKATTKEISVMVMVKCFGLMEATTKETGKTVFSTDKVFFF